MAKTKHRTFTDPLPGMKSLREINDDEARKIHEFERKARLFDRLLTAVKLERNERVKLESGWEPDPAKLDAASIEIVSIINEAGRKE